MIIYVPDPVDIDGVEVGCLCSLAKCACVGQSDKTLVDIGLTYAQIQTIPLKRYMNLINIAVKHGETYAIVPDVFCDVKKTVANFKRYANAIRQRGAKTVLVLQRFYETLDVYGDVMYETDVVALPAHRHCDVSCTVRPRLCAERISRALIWLARDAKLRVHLLGPAARVLKALGPALEDVYSFDTASYRRAPNSSAKKELGGKWQAPSDEVARQWLLQWLRQAGVVR
jgi:hypothetical protein